MRPVCQLVNLLAWLSLAVAAQAQLPLDQIDLYAKAGIYDFQRTLSQDGKVTSAEMTAPFEMMLKRMDRNRDGKIGPDDMHRRPAASAGGHHKGGGAPKK